MRLRGRSRLAIAGGMALLLQGCAAAVIPVAAGVIMGDSLRSGKVKVVDANEATERAGSTADTETSASIAAENAAMMAGGGSVAPSAGVSDDNSVELLDLTELPPPSGQGMAGSQSIVQSFADYSLEQAALLGAPDSEESSERLSALLESPGSLRPIRKQCGELPPAVLIDIDPGKETADPLGDIRLPARLAEALDSLRAADIRIAWVTRIGAGFADPLRMQLARRGYDRGYQDLLLMPAELDQRKQTLREELFKTHCIIAILGGDRYDFDELYLYLKNPDAAFALDTIIGQGWFLAPDLTKASTPPSPTRTIDQSPGDQ